MKDFITEAWLRANHTLSEGAEIHLPADARLTPSARELLESRHLRIKFIDEQGSLFIDDEEQQPQPVHGLTSSDTHPQASCELCHQPVVKKADTLTHLTADKMVAKVTRARDFAPRWTAPSPRRVVANRAGGTVAAVAGGYPFASGQHYARRRYRRAAGSTSYRRVKRRRFTPAFASAAALSGPRPSGA